MTNKIYFAANNGRLVTNLELARMAYVVDGIYIDEDNFDEVREYAKSCKGISKEVNPSIKVCLKNNDKIKAIMIYRDRHPGVKLVEAKNIIDDMEEKMKLGLLK